MSFEVRATTRARQTLKGEGETHETVSGCCANGWAPLGNMDKERTRTGDENLRAAMFEGPAGWRVDQ